tara:strand:+ start:13347 stop:14690 length:1344 start_codon:yes stop_codon:yes gene_type:complete
MFESLIEFITTAEALRFKRLLWVVVAFPVLYLLFGWQSWDKISDAKRRRLRFIAIAISLSFLLIDLALVGTNLRDRREWDFVPYWVIGQAIVQESHPYDGETLARIAEPLQPSEELQSELYCFYPPISLLLFAPLGWLPFSPALIAWEVVQFAALWWSLRLLVKFFADPDAGEAVNTSDEKKSLAKWVTLAVSLALYPTAATFFFAQTNFLILLTLLLFYRDREKPIAGVWLALGACVKPIVISVPLYLLMRGQWKAIVAMGATLVGVCLLTAALLGPQVFTEFLQQSTVSTSYKGAQLQNQSIGGTYVRLTTTAEERKANLAPNPMQSPVVIGLILLTIALTAVGIYRCRGEADPFAYGATLAMMLMIYPGTLTHYAAQLLPAIVLLVSQIPKTSRMTLPALVTLVLMLCTTKLTIWAILLVWIAMLGLGLSIDQSSQRRGAAALS